MVESHAVLAVVCLVGCRDVYLLSTLYRRLQILRLYVARVCLNFRLSSHTCPRRSEKIGRFTLTRFVYGDPDDSDDVCGDERTHYLVFYADHSIAFVIQRRERETEYKIFLLYLLPRAFGGVRRHSAPNIFTVTKKEEPRSSFLFFYRSKYYLTDIPIS